MQKRYIVLAALIILIVVVELSVEEAQDLIKNVIEFLNTI